MVQLVPMMESEYASYIEPAIEAYAQEKIRAGNYHPEGALQRARREFEALLPQELATPQQHFYTILDPDSGVKVGFVWLGIQGEGVKRFPTLFQLWISEDYRRRGYGTNALLALEERVAALGFDEIWLHVFGHNLAARALYEKLGYAATNVSMCKRLVSPAEPA
jgi:ribosomal protein S18 acetylase RimI-like enzyme